jgi:hypothetical protein
MQTNNNEYYYAVIICKCVEGAKMEEIFSIATEYYIKLESIKSYGGFKNKKIWFAILAFIEFVYSFYASIANFNKTSNKFINSTFITMLICETLALVMLYLVRKQRNEIFINYVNNEYNCHILDISKAKIKYLEEIINGTRENFYDTAKKIKDIMSIWNENKKSNFPSNGDFVKFIYDPNSNARIVTLCVFLLATISALSVRDGGGIKTVFEWYAPISGKVLLTLYAYIIIMLASMYFMIGAVAVIILNFIVWIVSVSKPNEDTKIRYVKYLLSDLTTYHAFKGLTANIEFSDLGTVPDSIQNEVQCDKSL